MLKKVVRTPPFRPSCLTAIKPSNQPGCTFIDLEKIKSTKKIWRWGLACCNFAAEKHNLWRYTLTPLLVGIEHDLWLSAIPTIAVAALMAYLGE